MQVELLEKEKSALADEVQHMRLDFVELVSRNLSLKKELSNTLSLVGLSSMTEMVSLTDIFRLNC